MNNHVYVLGSNSFSGAYFIKYALSKGYRVTGISRSLEAHPVFLPYMLPNGSHPKGFTFLQADLNNDLERIISSFKQDKAAYVVNFAAQGMVAESWQNPAQWFETNTVAPVKLYDALRHFDFLDKFVQISTPEVYGSTSGNIVESIHYEPSTPYAVSKAAADLNLMSFHKAYGFPVAFTRAANVFGAHQQLYRIIPRTVLKFLTGGVLELHGGGHSIRSFIHMEDVADATLKVMKNAQTGAIFHVSTTRQISIKDLVLLIAKQVHVNAEEHINVVGDRLGKDAAYLLDSTALREKLDWQDQISLEQGIDDVIGWVNGNLETLLKLPQNYEHKV